jgi:sialidase-1
MWTNLVIMMAMLVLACLATRAKGEALYSEEVVVPRPPGKGGDWPGPIIELKDGSLVFVHLVAGDEGGLWANKSTDAGRTWSEPYLFQAPVGLSGTGIGSLLRLNNGKILMSEDIQNFGQDMQSPGHDDIHAYTRLSSDEGQTWSYPLCATLTPGAWGINNGMLVQLSTGRIILPVETGVPVEGKYWVSMCVYSDNGGYTWWPSRNYVQIKDSYETGEPHVVELADGRLIMLARTRCGYMARSYSSDQGETWSPGELVKDLPASIPSPFALERLPTTGDLLCLWCRNPYGAGMAAGEEQPLLPVGNDMRPRGMVRAPLSSVLSHDDGQTWGQVRDLTHDAPGVYDHYGYPYVCFVEQGKIAVVNYMSMSGIRLARIDVDWFYGK